MEVLWEAAGEGPSLELHDTFHKLGDVFCVFGRTVCDALHLRGGICRKVLEPAGELSVEGEFNLREVRSHAVGLSAGHGFHSPRQVNSLASGASASWES